MRIVVLMGGPHCCRLRCNGAGLLAARHSRHRSFRMAGRRKICHRSPTCPGGNPIAMRHSRN